MKNKKYFILLATLGVICVVCTTIMLSFLIAQRMGYIVFTQKQSATDNSPEQIEEPSTQIVNSSPKPVERETPSSTSNGDSQPGKEKLITNSIGMKLAYIPSGECVIGDNDRGWKESERPVYKVEHPFFMGAYEVTQKQYQSVMGNNPSYYRSSDNLPVERISYESAVEFCNKLSQMEGITYRLPNEFEWEYACRAGAKTKYHFGDDEALLEKYAWYEDNSGEKTHPVGLKKPNKFGLYDIHGNVWEWCRNPYLHSIDDQFLRGGAYDWGCDVNTRIQGYTPGFAPGRNKGFRVMTDDWRVILKF